MTDSPAYSPAERRPTTERLINAAIEIFSKKGMAATTREIAEAAGVNEVTLFRQFESKDHLIEAVTREIIRAQSEALDQVDLEHLDLRRDLTNLAHVYERSMTRHQAYIRFMLSQPFDPPLVEKIRREIVEPWRARFIAYLGEGQRRGIVRQVNLAASVDAFTGMIFAHVLRCSVKRIRMPYSRETYIENCVDMFLHGICHGGSSKS